ncbi:crossover junction endodeoxyribonuclease RuvC [Parvularcula maris]|uniref:Crossover junction endodeoxyribonuclease RuvC n=1 Tax=Parvularcula maris TaxID=2965077 RepID=A0A9X2RJI0_9PROT|nr:crossover junction endodeoxyribonuclease RuvC [Parvularcula maris]MCQ8184758.1 crossover junction endodeoxyribonuclease RuvC [Parvularcula maris]
MSSVRIIGIDPGLRHCGWGVIEAEGSRLRYIASGRISPSPKDELATRLCALLDGLERVLNDQKPQEAAVEETFVNRDPRSALKLGQARGVCLLAPARYGIEVAEYAANLIKKSVVGTGHADKTQVSDMVSRLLPGSRAESADAADALAIALCHSFHRKARMLTAS